MTASLGKQTIRDHVRFLNLSGQALCIHSSLRSFGRVDGGARTVVDALLEEGCTVLVPTFTEYGVPPPPQRRPARNGWDYDNFTQVWEGIDKVYTPATNELDQAGMGAIPAVVVQMPGRIRGNHPLCSFTAVRPLAHALIAAQAPLDVNAPLAALAAVGGFVVLMGVGLDTMTLLHLAEQHAGRTLFRRWANGPDRETLEVETGGCSDGFDKLEPFLAPVMQEATVGNSQWRIFPAQRTLALAAETIRRTPMITHCGKSPCRCDDAVLGGPLLG